jgi:hypothetical protein
MYRIALWAAYPVRRPAGIGLNMHQTVSCGTVRLPLPLSHHVYSEHILCQNECASLIKVSQTGHGHGEDHRDLTTWRGSHNSPIPPCHADHCHGIIRMTQREVNLSDAGFVVSITGWFNILRSAISQDQGAGMPGHPNGIMRLAVSEMQPSASASQDFAEVVAYASVMLALC